MESPSKRIKLADLSADDQLSPDSLKAKMNVNFKNVQQILDAFYKYHFRPLFINISTKLIILKNFKP